MDLLLSSLTSMLFLILLPMTIIFYKKALQACGERGFLQVYFTCPTHYNNWKKDNYNQEVRIAGFPPAAPNCTAIIELEESSHA